LAKNINQTVATECNTGSGKVDFFEENKVQDVSGFPAEQPMLVALKTADISCRD